MALPKRVKQGGSYFKGYQLAVATASGDYVLHIVSTRDTVVNSIQVIPDDYGVGDYVTIGHFTNSGSGAQIDALGDTLYNLGAGRGIGLNFPALEPFRAGEDLRVTYTNAASVPLALSVIVEFVR